MKLSDLKIGMRLWIGFGLVIALTMVVVTIAIGRMGSAEQRVDNILGDRYCKIAWVTQIKYNVALIHQQMRDVMIASDAAGLQHAVDAMNAIRSTNKGLLEAADKLINVPRARELFTAIMQARTNHLAA